MSDYDFGANQQDGNGVDWPIRYADISPWYDRVERFAGISGATEGLDQLPDGQFLPPMELNCLESAFKKKIEQEFPTRRVTSGRCAHLTEPTAEHIALGRGPCQMRSNCERGCGYGAYFSSLSATLPAAQKTGNLTVVTDAIVERLDYDHAKRRISGVRVIDTNTKQGRSYQARVVFVCASTIGTAQILLASQSEYFPRGLANRSDAVGRHLMDHVVGIGAAGTHPGFLDRYYYGRRPTGFYLPRYVNLTEKGDVDFLRGYGFQGYSRRSSWERAEHEAGVGAELKERLRMPGPWEMRLIGFGEMLPRADNRVTLHATRKDRWGLPLVHIDCTHGENERRLAERANRDAVQMLVSAGFENVLPLGELEATGPFHARDGNRPHGARPRDFGAQWPQPGARRTEPVHHRRLVHDFNRLGEPLADLHGPVRAGCQLRRGPTRLRRDVGAFCAASRVLSPWPPGCVGAAPARAAREIRGSRRRAQARLRPARNACGRPRQRIPRRP